MSRLHKAGWLAPMPLHIVWVKTKVTEMLSVIYHYLRLQHQTRCRSLIKAQQMTPRWYHWVTHTSHHHWSFSSRTVTRGTTNIPTGFISSMNCSVRCKRVKADRSGGSQQLYWSKTWRSSVRSEFHWISNMATRHHTRWNGSSVFQILPVRQMYQKTRHWPSENPLPRRLRQHQFTGGVGWPSIITSGTNC